MKNLSILSVSILLLIASCSKGSKVNDIGNDISDSFIQDSFTLDSVETIADTKAEDTVVYQNTHIFPGPDEIGYNTDLAKKALRFDRSFWALHASVCGLDCEASVAADDTAAKDLIRDFITKTDSWDFEAYTKKKITDVIKDWSSIPGLYAGMGIGADAFRYALLRDNNASKTDIDRARQQLLSDLEIMHIAFTIGGVPGVVARGLARKDVPGDAAGIKPTPLFDKDGNPLPKEKNNGEWRDDNSGKYPNYYWNDSISRDYIMGWAFASGAVSEVIRNDPKIPQKTKDLLKTDAADVVKALSTVRKSGYDLEIVDADGRTTLNGYLNEHALERNYLPQLKNGFYAMMSLGIVGAFTYASEDPEAEKYLYDELIKKRKFPDIAKASVHMADGGIGSNFSNYNMVLTCAFMAGRYIKDPKVRDQIRDIVKNEIYARPGKKRQPIEQYQAWYDIVYAATQAGDNVFSGPDAPTDPLAIEKAIKALSEFPETPCWDTRRENCDQAEQDSKKCVLDDGTTVDVLGNVGRNHDLICKQVIPVAIRVPSNYHWRSNPYIPNGGGNGNTLLAGVDFRVAYWTARYIKALVKK